MQSSHQLQLSPAQQEAWISQQDHTALLEELIQQHGDQLAYMLQAYYAREKVSQLVIVPGSITVKAQVITLQLEYVMEEYNACSAVDTLQKQRMTVSVIPDAGSANLELKGEYWPERD